jgi:predicted Zn-dependent protease with MMP-like domain
MTEAGARAMVQAAEPSAKYRTTANIGRSALPLLRRLSAWYKLSTVDKNELRKEVARVLDKLPRQFRKELRNVEIVIEERPDEELFIDAGLDPEEDTLYGLYQGVPLPDRSSLYPPILPDKITIFSEPLLRDFPDPDELREQIRTTVLHELAHYFGFDDDEIDKLGY